MTVKHEQHPVWFDGDTMVIRASALGGCTRAMAALASGFDKMEPPDAMQRRFDDGHLHEASILAEMERQSGHVVDDSQTDAVLVIKPGLEVRGHVDGRLTDALGRKGVAEAKSMSDAMFKKYLSAGLRDYEGYQYQISVYMLGTDSEFALYGVKNKNSGVVDVRTLTALPKTRAEVVKRALEIERVVRAAMDHTAPAVDLTCDRNQYPCPVYYLHEEKVQEVGETVVDEVLLEMVAAYDLARAEAKAADERKSRLADEIKMRLEALGKEKVDIGQWHVTATYGERSTLDEKRLKADYPNLDLAAYKFKKRNSTPTLTVVKDGE